MNLEFSWWLLLPILLSVLYGYTECFAKVVLKLSTHRDRADWLSTALITGLSTVVWSVAGYPLSIFYLQAYLCMMAPPIARQSSQRKKSRFIFHINFANMLTLHLVTIGVAALARGATMRTLLASPFWRMVSVCVVLLVCIVENLCFLRWRDFSSQLASAAESEEAKPFMVFLWFCSAYLLIDSTLCMFELEPLYPPLFLIGSSAVVMFTLIRFLLHINALIKHNHLKEEHDQLASRLEATEESADSLRELADRDVLTGVYSRRYIMAHIDALLAAEVPFSLVYLDLDALKRVNDTLGHDAGDGYLMQFARVLKGRLRGEDLLARVGGDEFIVLMPGCDVHAAAERIQDIRSGMEQAVQGEASFRFSYGVTALQRQPKNAELLIREADQAMYRDKVQRRKEEGRL